MSQAFTRIPGLSGAAPPAGVHWKNTPGSQPVAGLFISCASIYTFRHDDDDDDDGHTNSALLSAGCGSELVQPSPCSCPECPPAGVQLGGLYQSCFRG